MKRPRLLTVLPCVCLAAASLRAPAAVTLAPEGGAQPDATGFLEAVLTIDDANGELPTIVRAVTLRRRQGGPTMWHAASAAPGTTQSVAVRLPVVSVEQSYVVRLWADPDGERLPLGSFDATIRYADLDAVERCRNALIDPAAYEDHLEDLPHWPGATIRAVLLAAVVFCIAMGGVLFIRRSGVRLNAALMVAVAAAGVMLTLARRTQTLEVAYRGDLLVVTCLRTSGWDAAGIERNATPVYRSQRQMDKDATVWSDLGPISGVIRPHEVRVLRRAGGRSQPATGPAPTRAAGKPAR